MPDVTHVSGDDGDCIWLTTDPDVASARESGRTLARALGFSVPDQISIESAIAELAVNMLTYARSGEIRLDVVTGNGSLGLRVVARAWGPANGRLELSHVQRLGDDFAIQCRSGRGTVVTVTKWRRSRSDAA